MGQARGVHSCWGFGGPGKSYRGEPNYEKIASVWPRLSESALYLAPKHSRMKFRIDWNGAILASAVPIYDPTALSRDATFTGRDPFQDDVSQFAPYRMRIEFAAGVPPCFETRDIGQVAQRLAEGYLPAVESTWRHERLEYTTLFYSTLLDAERVESGNEIPLGLACARVTNRDTRSVVAYLWIRVNTESAPRWDSGVMLDDSGRVRLILEPPSNARVTFFDEFVPDSDTDNPWWRVLSEDGRLKNLCRCEVSLGTSESAEFHIKIPYVPVEHACLTAIRSVRFKARLDAVLTNWKADLDRGMRIDVPERQVNEIFTSVLVPLFVTPDKLPSTGMVHYKWQPEYHYVIATSNYASIPALDQRGYHGEVEQYLEPWLIWQGAEKPSDISDNFRTKEGCFMIAATIGGFKWVQKNGWTLAAVCNHYRYTRDRQWLSRVLPNILASCDWIARERNATRTCDAGGQPALTYGLLPGGQASDWWAAQFGETHDNWIGSDAFNYMGLQSAAEVLHDVGHPRAAEIAREAADYRECIRAAVTRATQQATRIKYPDGSLVPWVPDELHRRTPPDDAGRVYARDEHAAWDLWLMYLHVGPLTLVPGQVFDAREDIITWALRFEEEYPLKLFYPSLAYPHPMLLYGTSAMLSEAHYALDAFFWRDEIDKYVEGVYGVLAGHLARTTYVATDHPFYGGTWGQQAINGVASQLIRRMLIQEDGGELLLAWATPRAWLEDGKKISVRNAATWFGPMSYEIISRTSRDLIEATIDPPRRNPPRGLQVKLRLRHPTRKRITSVVLNGAPWPGFGVDTLTIPWEGQDAFRVFVHYGARGTTD